MWLADNGGGPQPRSSLHRAVSEGVGEEVPTCGICAFPASPRATFTAYGEELKRVEVFKYLGQLIACDDADNQTMQSNLRKA
jgi:hypothetical protein